MIPVLLFAYMMGMAAFSQHPDYEVGFYGSVGECEANQLFYEDVVAVCLDPSVRWEYREPDFEKCLRAANDDTWELCRELRAD